jgi:nitrogen fixation/metabolism regulation signal transduction histidine kinase
MSLEHRIFWLVIAAGLPASATALFLLWTGDFTPKVQWTFTLLAVGFWLGGAMLARERVAYPLQTLANLLEALREGDYSLRGRRASPDDALGQVLMEVNALSSTLQRQRFDAVDATVLLSTVIEEIDVALFAFDGDSHLQLINRAGCRILGQPVARLMERPAAELGLADWLQGEPPPAVERAFPGGAGRWGVRRQSFRLEGRPHQLLVLTDLSRTLREEERQAWRRLIRVLGHELNNSLAPIKSMAATLRTVMARDPRPEDWEEDLAQGLKIIAERSEALRRFIASYAQLARLPEPTLAPVAVGSWLRRGVDLEHRLSIHLEEGPEVTIRADGDQLDQLLINLLRNAVDAAEETGGGVTVGWRLDGDTVEVSILDEGPGLASTDNLFVPFYSTKPGGTGIGLVLCRQIAEGHGGSLSLENRADAPGAEARLRLPVG